jgi:hypothetical protein
MKAIRTRFKGPTDYRGSRYIADDGDGNRITVSKSYEHNEDRNHELAAKALIAKMGWGPVTIRGGWHGGAMVWVMGEAYKFDVD